MSIGISIHEHDWSAIEEWFERRAEEAGHNKYAHTETVAFTAAIDQEIENAAESMSRAAAKQIEDIVRKYS